MNFALIGTRSFFDYVLMKTVLSQYKIDKIISGGARGADKLSEKYAKENNIEIEIFPADWNKYGKAAGFKRNYDIIDNCDVVIAFWNGESSGTKHSLTYGKKLKKHIVIIEYLKIKDIFDEW
jgi:hypothetical protein